MRRIADGVAIAALQSPLAWEAEPLDWRAGADWLEVHAGARTDLFVDPADGTSVLSAPRFLGSLNGDFRLSARVTVDFRSSFDAGVLVLWGNERTWAKLCFEASPQLEAMVVSVVTREVSDDCNSFVVEGDHVWLRVARLGGVHAFHASEDGARWHLVRYFALAYPSPRVGFLAQSPRGEGCTARFDDIRFTPGRLSDVRSGE